MIIAVTTLSTILSFVAGLIWPHAPHAQPRREGRTQPEQVASFSRSCAAWNNYVVTRRGELCVDVTRALVDIGAVDGYGEARFYTVIWPLPPKLNPDLPSNPHLPIFFRQLNDVKGPPRSLINYADGRWGIGPTPDHLSEEWKKLIDNAGYPILEWRSFEQARDWLNQNQSRLRWSPTAHIYEIGRELDSTAGPADEHQP